MLGISFRIFCGLCDSEVDFRSLVVVLVVLEWLLGCILDVLGCRWSSWGAILGSFWGSWGAVGVHFVGLGVPLGTFGAQSSRKTASLFRGPPFLKIWGPKGCPNGSQHGTKIGKKLTQQSVNFFV